MTTIIRDGSEQLLKSLVKDVERFIRRHEGEYKNLVRRDFLDGLKHKEPNEQIRWCNRWRTMYRRLD